MAPLVCQFCAADLRVPATRSYTGPDGYVYRMCQRHYDPIQQWRRKQAAEGAKS